MDEVRTAVEAFILAAAEVLTNANRSQFAGSLRKLYIARESLRQKCARLNAKLEAAKQRVQLQEGEGLAALEAAAAKPEQQATPAADQGAPSPGWPDQLLANSEGTPGLLLEPLANQLPDLPTFDLGSMDIDLKF